MDDSDSPARAVIADPALREWLMRHRAVMLTAVDHTERALGMRMTTAQMRRNYRELCYKFGLPLAADDTALRRAADESEASIAAGT